MNRFNLPDVNFLGKDPQLIESSILSHLEKKGFVLTNADPRRKFAQAFVGYITQERNNLDVAIKQNLLAYAEDNFLDHKGEDVSTPRLEAKTSVTTMEFILEEGRVDVLPIPMGTRFLVGEDTFFVTNETVAVPVGQHVIQVLASCMETGEIGNGYLPGEITNIVDPIPWVKEVRNVTTSSGGVDTEGNDPYAERIRIAPESFSTAGPEGAYEYWAKTASQEIVDVVPLNPGGGIVDLRILLKNGELPSQEILDKVLLTLSDKKIRPLTDTVIANAPEIVFYDAEVHYWVLQSKASVLNVIQENVKAAYQSYLKWQKEKMGRDVDLSELIARMKKAGAYRVIISSEMYKHIEKHQVAKESSALLTFGGLTDE